MLYGMGQAGLQHVGLPTDFDIQRKQYSDALKGAQVQVEQAHQRLLEQQQQYQQGLVTYQDPRTGFTYQVPPSVLPKLVPATVTGGYSLDKQTLANQGRFGVEQMKAMINAGIVRKYLDSVDENGNPGVQMLNQNGVPMGFVPGAVAKSFVPTYSTTQQHVQDKNGVWQVFDVTTAKTPGIPPGTGRVPSGSTPAIPSPTTPSISPTAPSGIPPAVKTRISPTSPAGKAMSRKGPVARPIQTSSGQPLESPKAEESVIGVDSQGNQVMASAGDAGRLGLTDVQKADANTVSSTRTARRWMSDIATVPGSDPRKDPTHAGVKELIDDLDKRGELGTIASRWNDFMAGKVGAGDPEYQALKTKLGLSNTLLAKLHVGARGNWFLIDEFNRLADAGKLTGEALKAAYGSEMDYVGRAQMMPQGRTNAPGGNWNAKTGRFE